MSKIKSWGKLQKKVKIFVEQKEKMVDNFWKKKKGGGKSETNGDEQSGKNEEKM